MTATAPAPTSAASPPPDLKPRAVGERIQDALLVLEIEQRRYGDDKECTVITLGNASGRLASRPFWATEQATVAGIGRGDVVQVIGEVDAYRGKRQLNVTSIRPLPGGTIDWHRLLPSVGDVAPYWERLDRWRAEMQRPRLRRVVDLFYEDEAFRERYGECPASTSGHHAELGGLLRHTCEVAAIGRAIARTCRADAELVLAGALLHDIGKLEAYTWRAGFGATECGELLGHVALGALMLDRRVAACEPAPCTDQELTLLHHLILSHHGKLEFGAPVQPMTLEAEVLHFADHASAKTASMVDALADPDNFNGDETFTATRLWQLDRRKAYRGKSDWGADR
jgi:3'-5' exoribonuclease